METKEEIWEADRLSSWSRDYGEPRKALFESAGLMQAGGRGNRDKIRSKVSCLEFCGRPRNVYLPRQLPRTNNVDLLWLLRVPSDLNANRLLSLPECSFI